MEDFPVILNVRATDSSNASIFNEVSVHVDVIDENDFPPVFPSSLLEQRLEEVKKKKKMSSKLNHNNAPSNSNYQKKGWGDLC